MWGEGGGMYDVRMQALPAAARHEKKKGWEEKSSRGLLSGAENAHVEGERKDAVARLACVRLHLRQ